MYLSLFMRGSDQDPAYKKNPDPYDWHITLLVGRLVRVRLAPGFHYLLNPPDPPNPSLLHTSYLFVVIGFSVWCGPVFRIRTFL